MMFLLLTAAMAGCVFDFSRSDQLRPGEVHGTAVGGDGAAIAHVRATVEGLLTPARADASGGFRVVLGAGVFIVTIDGIDAGPREQPGYLFDETTGRLMLFGGRDANGDDRNDLWSIAIATATAIATPVAAEAVLPAGRLAPVFVWDERGLFLVGGAP